MGGSSSSSPEPDLKCLLTNCVLHESVNLTTLRNKLSNESSSTVYCMIDETRNSTQRTALHVAAEANNTEVLQTILKPLNSKHRVDLCKDQNSGQDTPVHLAVWKNNVAAIRVLLDSVFPRAALFEVLQPKDKFQKTALHDAISRQHSDIVHEIVNNISTSQLFGLLKITDGTSATPLHYAFYQDRMDIFREMIDKVLSSNVGELVKLRDGKGKSIAHLAVEKGAYGVFQDMLQAVPMLERGSLMEAQDTSGQTVLHYIMASPSCEERLVFALDGVSLERAKQCMAIANEQGKTVQAQVLKHFGGRLEDVSNALALYVK